MAQYAPSADGQRFYLLEPVDSLQETELHVIRDGNTASNAEPGASFE